MQKVIDSEILKDLYSKHKSVWKVGEICGLCGQTVHNKLKKINGIYNDRWDAEEINILKLLYQKYDGDIKKISNDLERTYASIACKANELKITSYKRPMREESKLKLSISTSEWIKKNGHPKGMLNKNHTDKNKEIFRINSTGKISSETKRQKISDAHAGKKNGINVYSRGSSGKYNINGEQMYFRSSWEAVYAIYLNKLKSMNAIKNWEYEKDTFIFHKINRGIRSYTPDFKIIHLDDSYEYHEVKGYMDGKSKTKLKRFKKYYADQRLILITQKEYYNIKNIWNIEIPEKINKGV